MLRKQIKRPKISDDKGKRNKKAKREALDRASKPLGSKKEKLRSEKELESLVLGGEDDIIKELKSFTKKVIVGKIDTCMLPFLLLLPYTELDS